ncbi:MAG: C45 family peptidase [Chloroflexota bacterium]|nr:C45 family peptidase [Chloroflexota bacterium]
MIPLVETGGDPRQIGQDVGRAMRDRIQAAAAAARDALTTAVGGDAERAVGPFVEATERRAPEILAELRGMADGSGVPFATLFALNAGAELHLAIGDAGCTSVAVTPTGAANGHVLVAHNEDAAPGWAEYAYLVKAEPSGAPAFVAFSYAGLLLHQGLNAAGLASVGNTLHARDGRLGVPKLFQYRRILSETTIEGAIRTVIDPHRANGNNHLLATADGDVYDVETSGRCWALLDAGNRFLAHANHFTSDELRHLDQDEDLLNSTLRQARVERLVDRAWGRITPDALRGIAADHANFPHSVCTHHAPEGEPGDGTIGGIVIDVTTRVLWACAGNPCRGEWREVRL